MTTTTKERPILFSGPMVRAILDGRKTQTRRVIKPAWLRCLDLDDLDDRKTAIERCRHGKPGDRLWVREAFRIFSSETGPKDEIGRPAVTHYRATDLHLFPDAKWKPSIHMPRWASRITLEIIAVRVERLNEISRGDAMAEGCPHSNLAYGQNPCDWFHELWESINGPESWAENPWVWVIEFRKTEKES